MLESIFSKETPTQVFSCEIFEILKNIQHLFLQNNSGGCFYLYLKGGSVQSHLNPIRSVLFKGLCMSGGWSFLPTDSDMLETDRDIFR